MFRVEINIAGQDVSEYAVYPFTLSEKDIDDSLNLYEFRLAQTPFNKSFKPNRFVILKFYENEVLKERYVLILLNDVVTKHGLRDTFSHDITAVEYTQNLEKRVLPDMTITRISRGSQLFLPTLKDAVEKILFVGKLEKITLDSETETILDAIESPELSFTRKTVLEALRLVFAIARIVPKLITPIKLSHVGIGQELETDLFNVFSKLELGYNPETYNSAIFSNIEFMTLKEQFESIIEPKNG